MRDPHTALVEDQASTVHTVNEGSTTVVLVSGELDAVSGADLRNELAAILEDGSGDIVIDLGEVEFVDSSGLGVLVGGLKRSQQNGRMLRLRNLPAKLDKIFVIAGLSRVFDCDG
ncbi:MAG: anti-sigma factor antagonist [Acidimicrobiaceae bacterium]|nr:anti-sigma factor antagonist [Acidimicrobiaceae bacterium]